MNLGKFTPFWAHFDPSTKFSFSGNRLFSGNVPGVSV